MTDPAIIMNTLAAIEHDLAIKGNEYALAAGLWARKRAERKQKIAEGFFSSGEGSIEARKKAAEQAFSTWGVDEEARYEMMKAEIEVLQARSIIGTSLLKVQQ